MSGRGRGISNAPAWMTRQNKVGNGGNSGDGPTGLPTPPGAHQDRDAFGRAPRDGGLPGGPSGGGLHRYPPYHDRRGHYDDRRRGSYDDRRRGPYDDRRRGGPGDWNGGPPGRRGGRRDGYRDGDRDGSRRKNNVDTNNSSSSREQLGIISFRSYEEEQDWADERRRKRKARPSKFDVPPTAKQLAVEAAVNVASNPAATDFAGIPVGRDFSAVPQQTRHARRLYIGHLPPNVHEQELHEFFRNSIDKARVKNKGVTSDKGDFPDPILSVYINHERRFCFLEFRDVAMTTTCMALDGININGKGKVKVKRPNDYNPTMAPKVHPSSVPILDVSRLGIISSNVQDGPNKVFIGGLHYHLTETQVLELLQAFGEIKAFHLVKNEPDAVTSKGYCFVEFADPASTPVAVMGLNGMDMGGGKILTARVAGQRGQVSMGGVQQIQQQSSGITSVNGTTSSAGPDVLIVNGYEIEALVDAAMGLKPMPTAPTHVDQFGIPITKMGSGSLPPPMSVTSTSRMPTVPLLNTTGAPPPPAQVASTATLPPGMSALEIANAALDAAFGPGATAAPTGQSLPAITQTPTRILVLLNMVANEDLASDVEYSGLTEEVEEEVRKFGKLLSMQIPRKASATIESSAVGKIFLEYATIQDAANAEKELSGRQFGPNVVQASYHDEQEYAALKLC
mmetsp:Transcript_953/g.2050  ORF Transcript_953/g.2050 Transcript_953/m.2050 type:complete len:679 (+) Transcript_953:132-2168(+)|eukprot:CAMPEP_0197185912 /NCGR_PEP_ID=MMETSP1423-20130617/12900_1 /TAXON_ID=476441 /ORGANISM="Pseudo-nitzschia heimii, Strain UNC1101" /LENGTH=678 /DNA_ID=CAMNT_0042637089 /DNA_START=75 /DNA_END=2111 /DNA_ORIENTATION=-